MKTTTGDVIICQKPGITVRLVAVVLNDGDAPDDVRYWRPEGRVSAEDFARATIANTGGKIFRWDGHCQFERIDND
ncbi:MAG: hypothetical protein Q8T13_05145 [Acidobacteriota bacterium]|nr:hypothetical protein [Acidobacteriota bacterium]